MGKRVIGELPIFDFLIILSLGSVVGADIADPGVHHFPTAVAIVALGIFQRLVTQWKVSNRKIGRMITFEPTIVIKNGEFLNQNLKKIRYSIDNVLQMLRLKDVFDVNDVEVGIIEANGSLSVYKRANKKTTTVEDLGISKENPGLALPVIVEGKIYSDVLFDLGVDQTWLKQQLAYKGIKNKDEVFFASANRNLDLHVSLKSESLHTSPKLYH